MKNINKRHKEKKFLSKSVLICINCGSENISHNQFTVSCEQCGALNFYEVA